jgi:hypothetical protein
VDPGFALPAPGVDFVNMNEILISELVVVLLKVHFNKEIIIR